MTLRVNKALGIGISNDRIELALLKRDKEGLRLLKMARCAVPKGAVVDGKIENVEEIVKTIKVLQGLYNIQAKVAAISVPLKPLVTQIIQTPEEVPNNITHFIESELKSSVTLLGRKLAIDFCRLGTGSLINKTCRFLGVAADQQQLNALSKEFQDINIKVRSIEPTILAYIRNLYVNGFMANNQSNILIAIVQSNSITICVFKKQFLDFIRTIDLPELKTDSKEFIQQLATEIDLVIQFYKVELQNESTNWETNVLVADSILLEADAVKQLKSTLNSSSVRLLTFVESCPDIQAAKSLLKKKPPALPVGLAMRLLEIQSDNLSIDLTPKESRDVRSLKKDTLIAANVLAGVLIVAVLAIAVLKYVTAQSTVQITDRLSIHKTEGLSPLLDEKETVDGEILRLSRGLKQIKNLTGIQNNTDLSNLLGDIGRKTPKTLQITQLNYGGGGSLSMEGLSLSYEAIHLFEKMLRESQYLESASLFSETNRDEKNPSLIEFVIKCTVASKEMD